MVIEASDTIKPEHEDEHLIQEGTRSYLLHFPAEYRAGVAARVEQLANRSGTSVSGAILAVRSELTCQLGAPIFDNLSDEEIQKQREDLKHLVSYAVLAADDAASIRTFTEAESIRHIVRAAIGTLLANKIIQPVERGDWIKVGYPQHLM